MADDYVGMKKPDKIDVEKKDHSKEQKREREINLWTVFKNAKAINIILLILLILSIPLTVFISQGRQEIRQRAAEPGTVKVREYLIGADPTDKTRPGKITWNDATSGDIGKMCDIAGGEWKINCAPRILAYTPKGWDGFDTPLQIIGIGKYVWIATPVDPGTKKRTYLFGADPSDKTKPGNTATWATASDEIRQMCQIAGKTPDFCWPDILAYTPAGWNGNSDPTEIIGIGSYVWQATQVDKTTKKRQYLVGHIDNPQNPSDFEKIGSSGKWATSGLIDSGICQVAGKTGDMCIPNFLSYTQIGWDGFDKPLQVVSFGNHVWVATSIGTDKKRTYLIGKDPNDASKPGLATWNDATSGVLGQMCSLADKPQDVCAPDILAYTEKGWDNFTDPLQIIGIKQYVWVASSVQDATPTPSPAGGTGVPVPTGGVGTTKLDIDLVLPGIGARNAKGNPNPKHPTRKVTLDIYDTNNKKTSKTEDITYNTKSETFRATITLENLTPGYYTIDVSVPSYLKTHIRGIQTLKSGDTPNELPTITLPVGDINGDGAIDAVDYQILVNCGYGSLNPPEPVSASCQNADLDDDGKVDEIDYNWFIRSLLAQPGD